MIFFLCFKRYYLKEFSGFEKPLLKIPDVQSNPVITPVWTG